MFFVQSMLPEFSQHCSTDCIALIAANTGNVLIQSRALDTLELLLFKGRITQHKVDIDMLYHTQHLLAQFFQELRDRINQTQATDKYEECLVQRLLNIICMLQIETVSCAKDSQPSNENGIFGIEMRQKNKKLVSVIDEGLYNLENLRYSKLQDISRQISNCKDQEGILCSKQMSNHFVAVFLCLKQLFTSMELEVISSLEECVKSTKRKPMAIPVVQMLFRGLTHFLCNLRETPETDITKLCEGVVGLIDLLPQQNMAPDVERVLVSLMFEVTPVIRRNLIDMFKRKQLYNERLPAYIVQEIEQSLTPLLVVDKKNVESSLVREEWFQLKGKYCGTAVDIHVHKLTEECHRSSDCINFRRSNSTQQHMNQMFCLGKLQHEKIVKILACQDENIPLFYITEHHKNLQRLFFFKECLKNKMENGQPYTQKELLDILIHVAEALTFCHSKDFVHANLTAASVFIGADGVKLGGFYIATFVQGDGEKLLDDTSKIPTRWSAPETLKRFKVSKMSDVWMLALLMYEVLTHGLLPYSHIQMDDQECANRICDGSIRLCKETNLRAEHYRLIEDCTRTDPKRRPSMEVVQKKLIHFSKDESEMQICAKDAEMIKRRSSFFFTTGDRGNNYSSRSVGTRLELKEAISEKLHVYVKASKKH
ncbi:ephrin type-B receptor 3-like [Physella acuta]|uniref:ephrin type-B receptor 3-like n=1 Tax=Physella acuta TaxID=109671 RepID=UPI0027DC99CD|nr:ephrin type-B receptor 3-like [Physella acuta]